MNLILKPDSEKDLESINYLNSIQKDFRLNSLDNAIIDAIVYDGNIVVCYGIVKKIAEAIILVNYKTSKLIRARALRELMLYAEMGAAKEGVEQLQCFVQDEHLGKLLEKQFGFVKSKDIILVKNLGE